MDPANNPKRHSGLLTPLFGSDVAGDFKSLHHIQTQLFLLLDQGNPKEHHNEIILQVSELKKCKKQPGNDCVRTNENGEHILHIAILRNREDVVEALLASPLGKALIQTGNPRPLILAAEYGYQDIVKMIAQKLMSIGRKNELNAYHPETKDTALHIATKKGFTYTVEVLLAFGADFMFKNKQNRTAAECTTSHKRLRLFYKYLLPHYTTLHNAMGSRVSFRVISGARQSVKVDKEKLSHLSGSPQSPEQMAKSPTARAFDNTKMEAYQAAIKLKNHLESELGIKEDFRHYHFEGHEDHDDDASEYCSAHGENGSVYDDDDNDDDVDGEDLFELEIEGHDNGAGMGMGRK